MMMLDDELTALWRKEIERERNPAFEIAMMRRIERALYRRAIVLTFAVVVAATLLLGFFVPLMTAVWRQTFAHFVSAPVLALLLMALSILLSKISVNPVWIRSSKQGTP
jgi:hypothetical protein